jgi:rubrerythrin
MSHEKINEILDFAIEKEEEAYRFYIELASRMDKQYMKTIFEDFAREEQGHKAKLEGIKKGEEFKPTDRKILDLKLADYMVDVEPDADLDYQKALTLAMKKEKAAYKLYNDLAEAATDANLKNTFKALAQEEAKHKLRFEIEYDDVFLRDN